MKKENDIEKEKGVEQEDLTLKKIRYYQGSIKDFEDFWKRKIEENDKDLSKETKSCRERNADLNKAFEIIPVEEQ